MLLYKLVCVCFLATTKVNGIDYRGCYLDNELDRVLKDKRETLHTNTPEKCARYCSAFRYAGVESGLECYCGHALKNNATEMPDSDCEVYPCWGDSSRKCGAAYRISVYTNWENDTYSTVSTTPLSAANTTNHDGSTTYSYSSKLCSPDGYSADVTRSRSTTQTVIHDESSYPGSLTTEHIDSSTTIDCTAKKPATQDLTYSSTTGHALGVGIGIGLAIGLLCAVGIVVVILVLRRRRTVLARKYETNTDNTDKANAGSLEVASQM